MKQFRRFNTSDNKWHASMNLNAAHPYLTLD
jgi:hypothetical protein